MSEKEKELMELAKKIAEWIRKNQTPHTVVVIGGYSVRVMSDDFGAPIS